VLRSRTLVASLLTATTLAACSDGTSPNAERPVSLSFTTGTSSAAGVPLVRLSGTVPRLDLVAGTGEDAITITKAQVVLRQVRLERSAAITCSDDAVEESDDCAEIELGPVLVDLPLTADVTPTLDGLVPAGTYARMKLQLHKPSDHVRDAAFLTAHPEFEDVSVRVEGTYRGEPFVFTSSVTDVMHLGFNPPLLVEGTTTNVTVGIDVASWFAGTAGATLSPTDPANASAIASRIQASFRAFGDGDRDGHEDDGSDD